MSSGQDYFPDALQAEAALTSMLKKVILKVGQRWPLTYSLINQDLWQVGSEEAGSSIPAMFKIVDRIALHINNMVEKKD